MKIQQILEKLKNNLEIDSKEIEVLKSQLPNNTHTFIQECLENKGRVTIDDTSKICFEYFETLGLCSSISNISIKEYMEKIGFFVLKYDNKILEKILNCILF